MTSTVPTTAPLTYLFYGTHLMINVVGGLVFKFITFIYPSSA